MCAADGTIMVHIVSSSAACGTGKVWLIYVLKPQNDGTTKNQNPNGCSEIICLWVTGVSHQNHAR